MISCESIKSDCKFTILGTFNVAIVIQYQLIYNGTMLLFGKSM